MTQITTLDWKPLLDGLRKKEFSSRELTEAYLSRIDKYDARIGSYLHLTRERALADADASDERRRTGALRSSLDGVPLGLKDLFLTKGIPTSCASKLLEGYLPPYNSTVAERLEQAGTVLLGKLNMDEFAMGSSNENSAFHAVKNPWNEACVPGGSSGGSAAAVAASLCAASVGTDTGGSIRQPAALCGITGLKPTYGRVSRYGMIAFASSLDQAGPMAREASACADLLGLLAGHDPQDATSSTRPVASSQLSDNTDLSGLRIGLPAELFVEGLDPEVRAAVEAAAKTLEDMGATLVEVTLPHTAYATATYYIVATAEASSNLARYDGVRFGRRVSPGAESRGEPLTELYERTRSEGFGPEVKRRILLGTYVLSSGYYDAYYRKAQKVRTLIKRDFDLAFAGCDLLLSPTTPAPAFRLGDNLHDPLQMYLSDILTISCNLAGLPGLSLPCGASSDQLPIGLQLIGRSFDETTLLQVAHAYQQVTEWHRRRPTLEERS